MGLMKKLAAKRLRNPDEHMTVLKLKHMGRTMTCDKRCYCAEGDKCQCLCGGANHGKGEDAAVENSVKRGNEILDAVRSELNRQTELEL